MERNKKIKNEKKCYHDNSVKHKRDYKIIELELGSIDSRNFRDYKISTISKNKIRVDKNLPSKVKVILFMILFVFIGPLMTLFFHKNAFNFFYHKIKGDYLQKETYLKLNNDLISRFILFTISLLISFNIPLLILYKWIENKYDYSYNWNSLYNSLKNDGYIPHKFKNGYLTVAKFSYGYACLDGNHRKLLLESLYGKKHKIKVKYLGKLDDENSTDWYIEKTY